MKHALLIILLLFLATPVIAADSDGDGFEDDVEIANGYDPYGFGRLADADTDTDGLSNADEVIFGTDMLYPDSDFDGYADGLEVMHGYDPLSGDGVKLKKSIVIDTSSQTLTYMSGPKAIDSHIVSTGRPGMSTPKGTFTVGNKYPRAWSASAKLWMPYWLGFIGTVYGIHELPEWPNGQKEGASHLGIPVSHGCVRLGTGPAKSIYDWADIGTEVVVR